MKPFRSSTLYPMLVLVVIGFVSSMWLYKDRFSTHLNPDTRETLRQTVLDAVTSNTSTATQDLRFQDDVKCPRGPINENCFTVVIQSYERLQNLQTILRDYVTRDKIAMIVLVWNNVKNPLTLGRLGFSAADAQSAAKLKFVRPRENRVRNRFRPFPFINTTGIFVNDDDLIVSKEDMYGAFEIWKKNPDRIVGFKSRTHRLLASGNMKYLQGDKKTYSMILTSSSFVHADFVRYYETQPSPVLELVDATQNCDDIAMNYFVAYVCKGPSGLLIDRPVRDLDKGSAALEMRSSHYSDRSKCLAQFSKMYNAYTLPFEMKHY